MEKKSNIGEKVYNILNIVFSALLTILLVFLIINVFAEAFGQHLCEDVSTCYAIVIFLVGTIITIKMKILDSNNSKLEWILFVVGAIVNFLMIGLAYYADCMEKNNDAILLLNCLIWLNTIVIARNIILVTVLYFKNCWRKKSISNETKESKKQADLFKLWLDKKDNNETIKRALTDNSLRNVNHELKKSDTNLELATYGDAIIKMCLSKLLLDDVSNITLEKSKYESDKFLVERVAKKYDLVKYIKKDNKDERMPNDYNYGDGRKKNNNPRKYIATAVEAMVAAIYQETNDLDSIIDLVDNWRKLN